MPHTSPIFLLEKISWHNLSHPGDDVASASIIITKSVSIIDRPRFTALVFPGIVESNTSHLDCGRGDFFRVFSTIFLVLSSDDELTTTNLVFSEFIISSMTELILFLAILPSFLIGRRTLRDSSGREGGMSGVIIEVAQLIHVHSGDGRPVDGQNLGKRHIVLTPMRNEGDFIEKCAQSMIEQTIVPIEWIIIDDSSSDSCSEIIKQFSTKHSWIKIVKPKIAGKRGRGEWIARLMNFGLGEVTLEWDFCSKIDADIVLPSNYFEEVFSRFESNSSLGIASGGCYVESRRRLRLERVSEDHTRGALKTYLSDCFSDIGGIKNADGWDGIDNIQAQMSGWETRNFPEIKAIHLRKTGSRGGELRGCFEAGRIAHHMGYHPIFIIVRSIHRMLSGPFIVGGFAMLFGFFKNWISGSPIFEEGETVRYLRRKQLKRLGLTREK